MALRKYELSANEKVTNACYLLFSKNDIFTATIELGRFSDPISIKDGLTVRCDLFEQVDRVIEFVKKHINKEYIITDNPQREERWQYPIAAIREIVINMIVHRDYTHSGSSSIKIFNHRIEFYNPGKLPESITIDKILTGDYVSEIRNLKIAALFKEVKLIEKYGSGFFRIIKAFKEYNLKSPVFENFQSGFRVIVYANVINEPVNEPVSEPVNEPVNERQHAIIGLLQKNKSISINELADYCKVGRETIKRDLKKLKELKLLKRIGSDKSGHWQITSS